MKQIVALCVSLAVCLQFGMSQPESVGIRFSKNNLGLPFGNLFQPTLGPGVEMNATFKWRKKKRVDVTAMGGFYLKDQDGGVYAGSQLIHSYSYRKLDFGFLYGLAYLHSFNQNKVYDISSAPNWEIEKHSGVSSALIRAGLHMNFWLSEHLGISLVLTEALQIPYTKLVGGAIRSSVQIGGIYRIQQREEK